MKKKISKYFYFIIKMIVILTAVLLIYKIIFTNSFKKYALDNVISNYDFEFDINDLLLINKNVTNNKIYTSYISDSTNVSMSNPIIYIYNTHQSETYYSSYLYDYSLKPNVMMASYIMWEELKKNDIVSLVESENINEYMQNNNINTIDSYKASRHFLLDKINNYESIKYYIDIHRDSLNKEQTYYEENGVGYAQIMFVVGKNNENYKENYEVVSALNNLIVKEKEGISKGISLKEGAYIDGIYNQDLDKNVMLIEIGGVENTIEEVNNTIIFLSKVIKKFIGEENGN